MRRPPASQLDSGHHTRAVKMASDHVQKVIDSFKGDPTFMGKSRRAQKSEDDRAAAIAGAPSDIQSLRGLLPDHIIERLARVDKKEG